jgi:hypothetical protein
LVQDSHLLAGVNSDILLAQGRDEGVIIVHDILVPIRYNGVVCEKPHLGLGDGDVRTCNEAFKPHDPLPTHIEREENTMRGLILKEINTSDLRP